MSDEIRGFTKWQLALAIGAGTAAVVGISILAYVALKRDSSDRSVKSPSHPPREQGIPDTTEAGDNINDKKRVESGGKSALDRALDIKAEGNALYKQKKYEEAIECYKEAMSVCPPDNKDEISKFHQNIAAAYDAMVVNAKDGTVKIAHLNSVIEHCSQALLLNPRYTKALARRLKAYEVCGRKKEALLDVTRVIILDDSQGGMLGETVARLLKDISKEQAALQFPKLGPLTPNKLLVKTYVESFVWKDDLSEERLKELWISHKESKKLNSSQEKVLNEDQEPVVNEVPVGDQDPNLDVEDGSDEIEGQEVPVDQSESTEESQDEGFDNDPFVRAAAMFRNQQYHGIIESLTDAIENACPVYVPHATLLRGTLYMLWRENEKALCDLEAVINMPGVSNEMMINCFIKKANVYAGSADISKVKSCFDKCFVMDSSCPDCLIHRARVNLESPEDPQTLDSVLEDLKSALKVVPESAYAAFSLATAYHRMAGMNQSMSMLTQAATTFEEASKKFPDFVDGMVLYALYLQDMNQCEKAEEILKKAVRMEPDNSTVHFSLGILSLVYQRDPEKAAECMRKALTVDNSCIHAYDTLASLEIQKGNSDQAMELYDKAIQFSRSQAEMGQALVAREVISAQNQVCLEYKISMKELAARAMPL